MNRATRRALASKKNLKSVPATIQPPQPEHLQIRSVEVAEGNTLTISGKVVFIGAIPTRVNVVVKEDGKPDRTEMRDGFKIVFAQPVVLAPAKPQKPEASEMG